MGRDRSYDQAIRRVRGRRSLNLHGHGSFDLRMKEFSEKGKQRKSSCGSIVGDSRSVPKQEMRGRALVERRCSWY